MDVSEAWKRPEKGEYFFGGHDENRIQFSVGRDIALRPRSQGGPLNYFIYPYAEAGDDPVGDIKREFHFNDLRDDDETPGSSSDNRLRSGKARSDKHFFSLFRCFSSLISWL